MSDDEKKLEHIVFADKSKEYTTVLEFWREILEARTDKPGPMVELMERSLFYGGAFAVVQLLIGMFKRGLSPEEGGAELKAIQNEIDAFFAINDAVLDHVLDKSMPAPNGAFDKPEPGNEDEHAERNTYFEEVIGPLMKDVITALQARDMSMVALFEVFREGKQSHYARMMLTTRDGLIAQPLVQAAEAIGPVGNGNPVPPPKHQLH